MIIHSRKRVEAQTFEKWPRFRYNTYTIKLKGTGVPDRTGLCYGVTELSLGSEKAICANSGWKSQEHGRAYTAHKKFMNTSASAETAASFILEGRYIDNQTS